MKIKEKMQIHLQLLSKHLISCLLKVIKGIIATYNKGNLE